MSFEPRSDFLTQACDGFCNRVADGTHDSPQESETGKLLVTSKNVKDGRLTRDSAYCISIADFDAINKRSKVDQWDLLLTMIGTVGEVCIVEMSEPDFAIKNVGLLKCGDKLRAKWLYYFLRSPMGQEAIEQRKKGSTQQYISLTEIRQLPISYPSQRQEMQLIVEHLAAFDDRINLLRETNATLEAMAHALFKSWFVDFDPIRAKMEDRTPEGIDEATARLFPDNLEEAELGLMPSGWNFAAIRDVVEGVYDGPHATPPEADAGPVFLGIKNLTGTALNLSEIRHIAEAQWEQWTRRVEPQSGDIVFSYEATLGFFALIPPGLRCCLGRRLALIRPKTRDGATHFWFHQFTAAPFKRLLEKHTIQGATVNRIALKEFPSYAVLNPPLMLQLAFDKAVAPLWAKIHENQSQAQTLTDLRDTLLPRLISGQLRVNDLAD
jgi:type I restriction enzyme S subunit